MPRNQAGAAFPGRAKKVKGKRTKNKGSVVLGKTKTNAVAPEDRQVPATVGRTYVPRTSLQEPPRTTRSPQSCFPQAEPSLGASSKLSCQQSSTHSHTFPSISCKPKPFGWNEPTGAVYLPSHWLPHSAQLALFFPISSPHQWRVVVRARAAYSHSASVGRRYRYLRRGPFSW
jgi:hypothetical protein